MKVEHDAMSESAPSRMANKVCLQSKDGAVFHSPDTMVTVKYGRGIIFYLGMCSKFFFAYLFRCLLYNTLITFDVDCKVVL